MVSVSAPSNTSLKEIAYVKSLALAWHLAGTK